MEKGSSLHHAPSLVSSRTTHITLEATVTASPAAREEQGKELLSSNCYLKEKKILFNSEILLLLFSSQSRFGELTLTLTQDSVTVH